MPTTPITDTHPRSGYRHLTFQLTPRLMPIDRKRYPSNWKEIATAVKSAAGWRCQKCGRLCLQPGQETPSWTKAQRRAYTLQVHHWNRNPEDNSLSNLATLCSCCHLDYHRFGRGNISPGQLSLELTIKN